MKTYALAAAVALTTIVAMPAMAAPNPASQLCERYRGELIVVRDRAGNEFGLCHLPDGYMIEEWTLLRMQQERQPIYVYPNDGGEEYFNG